MKFDYTHNQWHKATAKVNSLHRWTPTAVNDEYPRKLTKPPSPASATSTGVADGEQEWRKEGFRICGGRWVVDDERIGMVFWLMRVRMVLYIWRKGDVWASSTMKEMRVQKLKLWRSMSGAWKEEVYIVVGKFRF